MHKRAHPRARRRAQSQHWPQQNAARGDPHPSWRLDMAHGADRPRGPAPINREDLAAKLWTIIDG